MLTTDYTTSSIDQDGNWITRLQRSTDIVQALNEGGSRQ